MKVYVDPHEVECIGEQATCIRDRLLIRLLFRLGCRVSEVLGLAVSDVDFQQATVVIQHLKRRLRLSCPHTVGFLWPRYTNAVPGVAGR